MLLPARRFLLSLAALTVTVALATAQVPKVGGFYADKGDLGFKVRVPDGWDLIPPQPSEEATIIARYVPPVTKYIVIGGASPKRVDLVCWLVKFDRRKKEDADKDKKEGIRFVSASAPKDLLAWMKSNPEIEGGKVLKIESQKDVSIQKIQATEYEFSTPDEPNLRLGYYAMVYKLSPDVDVAIVFSGPGDPKKWSKWEAPFSQMAKSFAKVETQAIAGATATGTTLRDKIRAEQMKKLGSLGGAWKLYETPHYFILTPHEDRAFVEELKQRLERIHEIYEQDYPAAKAEEYRKAGETAKTGDQKSEDEKAQEQFDKAMKDMLMQGATPQELASCSRVRVFTDHDAYLSYGAPGGSAGYWSPMDQELVLYDDQGGGGRRNTWAVLNHEGFHQYIFYFFGALSPHSWYNEGSGDYYSGYAWKASRFVLTKFDWRVDTIKEAIREKTFVPLDKFVRYTQAEYYGNNKEGVDGGQNYAQGWSLIYFLRTGKKNNAKGWDPAWDNILETYLRVLATSNKLDQAVDEAFKGVDMAALERAWIDYTK
jgi:hypothetical protein